MYSKEQITQALKLHFFGTGSYYFKPFFYLALTVMSSSIVVSILARVSMSNLWYPQRVNLF